MDSSGVTSNRDNFDSPMNPISSMDSFTRPIWFTELESSLYYYRARYYDLSTGRFLSEDPVHFQGGVDFYSYLGNRPLNVWDPLGRWPDWDWSWLWRWGSRFKKLGKAITCVGDCVLYCIPVLCDNSTNIGKAQGGGAPVYLPGDLSNQGNPNYTGAPLASEGVRQFRMANSGNLGCGREFRWIPVDVQLKLYPNSHKN